MFRSDNYSRVNDLQLDQPPVIGQRSIKTIIVLPSDRAAGTIQFVNNEVTGWFVSSYFVLVLTAH